MNKKLNRLLQFVCVLFGVSFFTFALTYLAPGDPAEAMYTASGVIPTEAMLASARASMGLDEPFFSQYIIWLSKAVRGDLGTSFSMHAPVTDLLLARLGPTIRLALCSLLIMLTVSVPLGVLSALRQGTWVDNLIRLLSFIGISMPGFWIGLLLLYLFALQLSWLPVIANGTGWQRMILPAVTLAIAMASKYIRQIRAAVLEELGKDYVIGERARGISDFTILIRHVLPNCALPFITMLGLSLGSLLGGTAVVEIIFSYPGLGNLGVSAVAARDYPLIQGFVLWMAFIYLGLNYLVDFSYHFLDPRIRERWRV